MSEVLAGFVCGYMLALVSAPLVAFLLLRLRARVPLLARAVPEQVPVVALTVVLFSFTFLVWTGLGIVLGLIRWAWRTGRRRAVWAVPASPLR